MPRLRNARSSTFEDASSSPATSRGSASTIVTSAPNERHTWRTRSRSRHRPAPSRSWGPVEPQRVLGRDTVPSTSRPGSDPGSAGGEHDVPAGVRRAVDGHLVRPGQPTLALDDGDPATLDQSGQPLEQSRDDAVPVGVHAGRSMPSSLCPHAECQRGLRAESATSAAWSSALVGMPRHRADRSRRGGPSRPARR